jgi:hypothetical protein
MYNIRPLLVELTLKYMTTQEKALYIIELLELSDRQVADAIGVKYSSVSHKRRNIKYNKFTISDLRRLKECYLDKLRKIESIEIIEEEEKPLV